MEFVDAARIANRGVRPEPHKVQGSVRWFSPGKNYGFMIPDRIQPDGTKGERFGDVFIHARNLPRGADPLELTEGRRLICEVELGDRGWIATRFVIKDTLPAGDKPHNNVCGPYSRILGITKWYDETNGYGFFDNPNGPDIYVHSATLQQAGFRNGLKPGDLLLVTYGHSSTNPNKLVARMVHPVQLPQPTARPTLGYAPSAWQFKPESLER